MLTALQIGADGSLLMSRTGILEKAGFRVITAYAMKDAVAHITRQKFDVAILCHSLERAERRKIAALVRLHNPGIPVFLVARRETTITAEDGVDAVIDPAPLQLIGNLRRVFHATLSRNAAKTRSAPLRRFWQRRRRNDTPA